MADTDDQDIETSAFNLMREVIAIAGERWVSASRFLAIADRWSESDLQARITLLAGVKDLLRELPVKVFPDLDVRQTLLNAAQEALDQVIDMEDEEA